jgi:RNA polymerase sigma factor (sigma-70 family)
LNEACDPSKPPLEQLQQSEALAVIEQGLLELGPLDREILLLWTSRIGYGGIAQRLGISEEVACRRKNRAMERLRQILRRRISSSDLCQE